jgi:hypothetical protein
MTDLLFIGFVTTMLGCIALVVTFAAKEYGDDDE